MEAYNAADYIIRETKDLIFEGAELLKSDNIVRADALTKMLRYKYSHLVGLDYTKNREK
jgi:hypothetical protein